MMVARGPSLSLQRLASAWRIRSMLEAFGWGLLAASSLVLGAAGALRFRIGLRTIGLIMAFGAGVLISAVSFDLIEEAVSKATGHGAVLAGVFLGSGVFFGGDWLIDRAASIARARAAITKTTRRSRSCSAPSSTASPNRWSSG
jgi:hypothetical protein